MTLIASNDPKEIVKTLKKVGENVFKVTKEVIYAFPKSMTNYYGKNQAFIDFVKEHPERVLKNIYSVIETIKKIKQL